MKNGIAANAACSRRTGDKGEEARDRRRDDPPVIDIATAQAIMAGDLHDL